MNCELGLEGRAGAGQAEAVRKGSGKAQGGEGCAERGRQRPGWGDGERGATGRGEATVALPLRGLMAGGGDLSCSPSVGLTQPTGVQMGALQVTPGSLPGFLTHVSTSVPSRTCSYYRTREAQIAVLKSRAEPSWPLSPEGRPHLARG